MKKNPESRLKIIEALEKTILNQLLEIMDQFTDEERQTLEAWQEKAIEEARKGKAYKNPPPDQAAVRDKFNDLGGNTLTIMRIALRDLKEGKKDPNDIPDEWLN